MTDSSHHPALEVIAKPIDDGVGLGLGEDLVDDGFDPARAPLAPLLEIDLGAMAEDVRGRRGGSSLRQALPPRIRAPSRARPAAGEDGQTRQ